MMYKSFSMSDLSKYSFSSRLHVKFKCFNIIFIYFRVRIAKTKIIDNDMNPKWNETFNISVNIFTFFFVIFKIKKIWIKNQSLITFGSD